MESMDGLWRWQDWMEKGYKYDSPLFDGRAVPAVRSIHRE
jgi:hypothetical protein